MANTNVQTAAAEREVTSSVQFLTVTAIFVALTYIFTAFINVRLPIAANGGLIHLGNVPLFIGAIIFAPLIDWMLKTFNKKGRWHVLFYIQIAIGLCVAIWSLILKHGLIPLLGA